MRPLFFCIILTILVTGCANRQASQLLDKAQEELVVYVENANRKVKQQEEARLELELRLMQIEIADALRVNIATPEKMSEEIIKQVRKKIDERDERLQIWGTTSANVGNVKLLLQAVKNYHSRGATAEDIINLLDQFDTGAQPPEPIMGGINEDEIN